MNVYTIEIWRCAGLDCSGIHTLIMRNNGWLTDGAVVVPPPCKALGHRVSKSVSHIVDDGQIFIWDEVEL